MDLPICRTPLAELAPHVYGGTFTLVPHHYYAQPAKLDQNSPQTTFKLLRQCLCSYPILSLPLSMLHRRLAARSVRSCRWYHATRPQLGFFLVFRLEPLEIIDDPDDVLPYIRMPVILKDQLNQIPHDKYKFEFAYLSFGYHLQLLVPMIHSLLDLLDPTQLTTLLPRRRPHGLPADTLSIKAGDDAMLVLPLVLAIADGVSGWDDDLLKQGDLGTWLRLMLETLLRLMTEYKINHAPHPIKRRDIDQILDDLFLHTLHLMDLQNLKGLLTLILAMITGDALRMILIGDLRLFVFRNGEILVLNEEQMVLPLCPQQIGTQTLSQLPLDMAWVLLVPLEENDIIFLCSDGILDNLYVHEIIEYLDEFLNVKKDDLKRVASRFIIKAKEVAFDDFAYTPYNEKVNLLPLELASSTPSQGGKLDDMSLCIARVVPFDKPKAGPTKS